MEWIYKICELVGGTANISLVETKPNSRNYQMVFTLSEGVDRSILQDTYPHVIFSDAFHNLLTFDYLRNAAMWTLVTCPKKHKMMQENPSPSQRTNT